MTRECKAMRVARTTITDVLRSNLSNDCPSGYLFRHGKAHPQVADGEVHGQHTSVQGKSKVKFHHVKGHEGPEE